MGVEATQGNVIRIQAFNAETGEPVAPLELRIEESPTSGISNANSTSLSPAIPESSSPLQSLLRRAQFFTPKNLLSKDASDPADATQLTCNNSVNVSGSASFGDVSVGSSSSRYITVTNPNCCPVSYYIAGAPYGFSLSSSGGTISANSSTSFSITFSPQDDRSYYGSVSITPGGSSVSVSGRGVRR